MVDININLKVSGHEKLRDYLASATVGPLLAPWRALQEGKAKVIAAKADAEVQKIQAAKDVEVRQIQAYAANGTSQLIAKEQAEARKYVPTPNALRPDGSVQIGFDEVQNAMEFQAKKRLMNVGAIADHAAEELKNKEVSDHDHDPDWTARFFDGAQEVSSEELQKLWGRILAGEVKSPGQTSLRTLSILRDMTQQDAMDFSNLMRFRISNFIFHNHPVLEEALDEISNCLSHFSHIGLLSSFGAPKTIILGDNGQWVGEHCGHALIIEGERRGSILPMEGIDSNSIASVVTAAGIELAKICQNEPNLQYLSYFARILANFHCKLKLAKITGQDAEDVSTLSDVRTIEPFVYTEERDQQEPNNAE